MRRLAELVWAFALAMYLASCVAVRPDPLRVLVATSNAAADALERATKTAEEDLLDDYRKRVKACPAAPPERAACITRALGDVQRAFAPRFTELRALSMAQNAAADGLERARECRRTKAACEVEALQEAEKALNTVRQGLTPLRPEEEDE
jgi:hypothetical protein